MYKIVIFFGLIYTPESKIYSTACHILVLSLGKSHFIVLSEYSKIHRVFWHSFDAITNWASRSDESSQWSAGICFTFSHIDRYGGFARFCNSVHLTATALTKLLHPFLIYWTTNLRLRIITKDPAFQRCWLLVLIFGFSLKKCNVCPKKKWVNGIFWCSEYQ